MTTGAQRVSIPTVRLRVAGGIGTGHRSEVGAYY